MPIHQGLEGRLVTAADEVLQQSPIAKPSTIAQQRRPAKVVDDLTHLPGRHVVSLEGRSSRSTLLLPAQGRLMHVFGWGPGIAGEPTDGLTRQALRFSVPGRLPSR